MMTLKAVLLALLLSAAPVFSDDLGAINVEVDAKRKDVTITWSRVGDTDERNYGVEAVFVDGHLRDCRRCIVNFPANTHARTLLEGSGTWIPGDAPSAEGKGWWVRILNGRGDCLARFSSSETIDIFAAAQGKWKYNDVDPAKRTLRKAVMNTEKLPKKEFIAAAEGAVGRWTESTTKPWTFELKSDGAATAGKRAGKWRLEHRQIVLDWDDGWTHRFEAKPFEWEKRSRVIYLHKGRFRGMGWVSR